jgi:hypothetical protein
MSWLARLARAPARGRLDFIKDAPGIQVGDGRSEVIDTGRIEQLADAVACLREQLRRSAEESAP